jgi:DNA mismatch endonuclease (patch repair protein)
MPDNLTPQQRSYCMARIKGRDTGLERLIRSALHRLGLRFRKHVAALPGRPDIVFPRARVAVFIDGDFWHGYRFPAWEPSLSRFWRRKIAANRARDRRNFRRLRRMGWTVIRIWQHTSRRDLTGVLDRITRAVAKAPNGGAPTAGPAARSVRAAPRDPGPPRSPRRAPPRQPGGISPRRPPPRRNPRRRSPWRPAPRRTAPGRPAGTALPGR